MKQIDPRPIPMSDELKRKLNAFDWDLEEIKQEMPETVNYIVDCDEEYVYYEHRYQDGSTEKYKFDVYGEHYYIGCNPKVK